jgi:hypothetical protein
MFGVGHFERELRFELREYCHIKLMFASGSWKNERSEFESR